MMVLRGSLFPLLVTVLLPLGTNAAAYLSNTVQCNDISSNDETTTFEVCATGSGFGPSPAELSNGTVVYIGGYENNFHILKGLEEGADASGFLPDEAFTGINVKVARDDDQESCTVTVSGTDCDSCAFCGNDKYSADCGNIEFGRAVDCELSTTTDVFFPLTVQALEARTLAPAAAMVTNAPAAVSVSQSGAPNPTSINETSNAAVASTHSSVVVLGFLACLLIGS